MVSRMREADLFRVLQPKAYGGFEYGSRSSRRSKQSWRAAAARPAGCMGCSPPINADRLFSETAQDEVWSDPTALAAGTYAPVARAEAVDGGYRVSGAGTFCSGCDNAQWQFLGGLIPQADGPPQPGFFLFRTADITIDDNWHTMGLCGTAVRPSLPKTFSCRAIGFVSSPNSPMRPRPACGRIQIRCSDNPSCGATGHHCGAGARMAEGALARFDMAKVRTTRRCGGWRQPQDGGIDDHPAPRRRSCRHIDAAKLMMFRDLAETYAMARAVRPSASTYGCAIAAIRRSAPGC